METATCSLCSAWKGQLGLEPTVGAYIEHTMEWLREAKRVLRKDGVAWIDLGDSRSATDGHTTGPSPIRQGRSNIVAQQAVKGQAGGLPSKNLALIPARIAIACQDDGWIVRSWIIIPSWMPESAKDRPTDSYRTVLMLVRSPRYWYDAQAVRVQATDNPSFCPSVKIDSPHFEHTKDRVGDWGKSADRFDGLRNLGDIWQIPPAAYPDAHFATFATEEPETCIKASCPAEICVKCGKPRVRIVKKANVREHPQRQGRKDRNKADYDGEGYAERESGLGLTWDEQTVGWTDCGCGAGFEPGTVLDCFIGTGTTAVAARMLGRKCIGIDASEDYLRQAVTRLQVGDSGIRKIVAARRAGARQETLWE
jgi:DNA modification methylase